MLNNTPAGETSDLDQFLLEKEYLSSTEIEQALTVQKETGDSLLQCLQRLSLLKSATLAEAISQYYDLPLVMENEWPEEVNFQGRLTLEFLREHSIFPIGEERNKVILSMFDPGDQYAIEAVKLALNRSVLPKVASLEDIESAIEKAKSDSPETTVWSDVSDDEQTSDDIQHLKDMALGTPIVRFVNQLLVDAVRLRATDIHIEPFDKKLAIRMRIDGMLHEIESPPNNMAKAIISRIKILSELNIAERRLPQDGRARIRVNNHRLDLRVATIPTAHGESIAIRILDNVRRSLDFSRLGFSVKNREAFEKQLQSPYGMVIVTGPTGSGKTTTLATALSSLNQSHRKILTIEDPVEYELEGVNQTSVKPNIGLTFSAALRSILRHDPDIIMVGEMRDHETADIGIHAALTGHLVLTTLHTNSAAGTIPRLLDMGIDSYLLASSLRCLVGQRLVRRLCENCKEEYQGVPDLPLKDTDGKLILSKTPEKLWKPVGCDSCFNTGYSDRIVLSEIIEMDEVVQSMVKPNAAANEIEYVARQQGMKTMMEDGYAKCLEGITTPDEVRRVVLDI